jgi:hypothetical protein
MEKAAFNDAPKQFSISFDAKFQALLPIDHANLRIILYLL